jgi:hypothetical protein
MLVLVLHGDLLQSKRCDVGGRFKYRWAGRRGRCATYTS